MSSEQLELHLLGVPRVSVFRQKLKLTRKGLALLAFVALEGRTPREKIADLLWGELGADGASRNLRRELHRLRATALTAHLETEGAIGLQDFWADSQEISAKGELLEGLILSDAPVFMEWLQQTREKRQQQRLGHLRLAALSNPKLEQRLELQQEVLSLEPMSESDAQALMQTLIALGRSDEAKRVYDQLNQELLGVKAQPSLETARILLQNLANPEMQAAFLEQLGHGAQTLEYRLRAAKEAKVNNLPLEALGHYAAALRLQKNPKERFALHQERLKLILTSGQFDAYSQELSALLTSVSGDAQLEARALVIQSGIEFQQLEFAKSLASAKLALENPLLPQNEQGTAYYYLGISHLRLGQAAQAEPFLRLALEQLSESAGTEKTKVHHGLSQLALQKNNLPEAIFHNQAAADLVSLSQDRAMRSNVLSISGILAMLQGEYDKAKRLLETAKRECTQSQNMAGLPMIMANMAKAQIELGELPEAIESLEQGLSAARSTGNRTMEGQLLGSLAITHQERGNLGVALETYTAALEFAKNIQDARGMAFRHLNHVDLLLQLGESHEAKHHLEAAQKIIGDNIPDLQNWWAIQKAEWQILQNQYQEASLLLESLENHSEIEIRLNAKYLWAKSCVQQNKPLPDGLLNEHQGNPKWSIKILTLYSHLTLEQQTLARANLHKIAALDQWRLLRALNEPHQDLKNTLIESLETYPYLQKCLVKHLELRQTVL